MSKSLISSSGQALQRETSNKEKLCEEGQAVKGRSTVKGRCEDDMAGTGNEDGTASKMQRCEKM